MALLKTDELKKLKQKKYRQQFGWFLAEGEHLVEELQKATHVHPALLASKLHVTEKYRDWPTVLAKRVISDRLMQQIAETTSPQGIIACVPMKGLLSTPAGDERAIYLHQIQDPGNLGTILRTLAWFGGFRCLLSPDSVDPFNGKVVRASMGAIFHVPLETDVTVEQVSARYGRIGCLDAKGAALTSADFHLARCLAFGNEARGLPAEVLQRLGGNAFGIPGSNRIESLNLASVVNMSVYELCRS